MTEISKQQRAKELIKNACISYNLHQYIPAVQQVILNDESTWEDYDMLVMELEGRVARGQEPKALNALLQHQGANAYLIIGELKRIVKEAEGEEDS